MPGRKTRSRPHPQRSRGQPTLPLPDPLPRPSEYRCLPFPAFLGLTLTGSQAREKRQSPAASRPRHRSQQTSNSPSASHGLGQKGKAHGAPDHERGPGPGCGSRGDARGCHRCRDPADQRRQTEGPASGGGDGGWLPGHSREHDAEPGERGQKGALCSSPGGRSNSSRCAFREPASLPGAGLGLGTKDDETTREQTRSVEQQTRAAKPTRRTTSRVCLQTSGPP
jgi:hypothetical protein